MWGASDQTPDRVEAVRPGGKSNQRLKPHRLGRVGCREGFSNCVGKTSHYEVVVSARQIASLAQINVKAQRGSIDPRHLEGL
jgi:hypothetical protein